MANCCIREMIEGAGCRLVYLPPYSPDMSPIENIWSKAKGVLLAIGMQKGRSAAGKIGA